MSRYIDADKVNEEQLEQSIEHLLKSVDELISLKEVLRDTPTEDVAPVKHGQWIKHEKYSFGTMYDCSICSTRILETGDCGITVLIVELKWTEKGKMRNNR